MYPILNVFDMVIFVVDSLFYYIGFVFLIFVYVMTTYLKSRSYKRTEIGEEINEKIEGLKNYIKDLTNMYIYIITLLLYIVHS